MAGNSKRSLTVAGIYALFGVLWILLSDKLALLLVGDMAQLAHFQTVKGLAYIFLTATLVYLLTQYVLRRQAHMFAAVDESERRFRTMFEQAAVGIALVAPDGRWLRVNQRLCDFLGYTREEMLARSFQEDTHPDDLPSSEHLAQELRESTRNALQMEKRYLKKSGECVWARISAASSRRPDGTLEFNIVVIEDISRRKQAEAEREALEAQLLQAQKMEAIGRLAGGIAHDFNNMLAVILGYTELVMMQLGKDSPYYADLEQVQAAGQRSTALTRQLLAFARKETVLPTVLNLNKYIEESAKLFSRLLGDEIKLLFSPQAALWNVHMDPSQVDQVLANLTVNSRDAINGPGQIEIRLENHTVNEDFLVSGEMLKAGDYVRLTFSDTGCGMPKDVLQHIFEPFYTTKEQGKGTGLGLSTVYGIVEQNQGHVLVDSTPGLGTTFTILLPRHVGSFSSVASHGTPVTGGNETIFLAEDEKPVLNLCKRSLERAGYEVHAFNGPEEALSAAASFTKRIDLLVTDVTMPAMSGLALSQKLGEIFPSMPVLFMSGHTDNTLSEHGIVPEGMNFIQKPFTPNELAARVRGILDSADKAQVSLY